MAETARAEAGHTSPRETAVSTGTVSEMPTIPQGRVFGSPAPLGSDEFDFAVKPGSLRGQSTAENDAADYLNGGQPHERISPITNTSGGPEPSSPDVEAPPELADVLGIVDPPSPAFHPRSWITNPKGAQHVRLRAAIDVELTYGAATAKSDPAWHEWG
ncbi:8a11b774-ade8-4ca6-ab29-009013a8d40b [Thermothielavioides terrestris]|uniref:8a11b774-ade8-4ca6-ab29-009013a8d40b n=1 Tax=Thermothielavioides terrestris TaxID=2587410 RepID=A0A3S4AUX4_9PEZI|nr:8a11b774-ade8-4ca6-ab29-009013a8d40b [Thermothielavioides terrestris]